MKRYAKPSEITTALIGYGGSFNMGPFHISNMRQAGMRLTAVCDVDPKRTAQAAEDYPGIQTFNTVEELLRGSDAELVTIITPHNTHAKLVTQCLKGGRHVVVEKPMAITTAECDTMIAAARKSGRMLSVFHNRHWDGWIMHAVKTIQGGAIGDIVRMEAHIGQWGKPLDWWRSSKSISGGILYDMGVHLLEYILQLATAPVTEVSGFARKGVWSDKIAWKKDANEDEGFALLRFADGSWATLCITHLDANPKPCWIEITGTRGTYLMDPSGWQLITPKANQTVIAKGKNPPDAPEHYYQNIADHLVKGTPLIISAEYARRPIHFIDLACQSAIKGRSIQVKYG